MNYAVIKNQTENHKIILVLVSFQPRGIGTFKVSPNVPWLSGSMPKLTAIRGLGGESLLFCSPGRAAFPTACLWGRTGFSSNFHISATRTMTESAFRTAAVCLSWLMGTEISLCFAKSFINLLKKQCELTVVTFLDFFFDD